MMLRDMYECEYEVHVDYVDVKLWMPPFKLATSFIFDMSKCLIN